MSAIGILGGMGPQASARLVELLIEQTSRFVDNPTDSDFPEIIHLSVPVPNFISNKINMQKAKTILIERTKLLETAGSTINCIACNTAHLLLPELQAVTNVPFMSIPELVAEEIKSRGFKRAGLLASPTTLSSTLYDEVLGDIAEVIRPSSSLAQEIEHLIFKKLANELSVLDCQNFRKLVERFIQDQQLDVVILGCTELPLVYGKSEDDRVIDTLDVLSKALLKHYFA